MLGVLFVIFSLFYYKYVCICLILVVLSVIALLLVDGLAPQSFTVGDRDLLLLLPLN